MSEYVILGLLMAGWIAGLIWLVVCLRAAKRQNGS